MFTYDKKTQKVNMDIINTETNTSI